MDKKITPRKLPGFWELSPEKEIVFEQMIDRIKGVFQTHCFLPLDTPVMELSEVLLAKSGGDMDKEIYRFVKGSTDACLRYDFTVPLARYVAMNENTLSFPFKRFQIGKNYRGERPQKGRLREFYQCDADVVGDGKLSLVNDAECIKLYDDIFKALQIDGEVRLSSRKVLHGLVSDLGLGEQFGDIAITLDKLDKVGVEEIQHLLKEIGVSESAQKKLVKFVQIRGGKEALAQARKLSSNAEFTEGINELEEICSYIDAMGTKNYVVDFGIIRGHNYYTGFVFEAFIKGKNSCGAIGGGGRYDELASCFSNRHLPGVGMSVGLSRLFGILEDENMLPKIASAVNVAIIPLGETLKNCIEVCSRLQEKGIKAEVLAEEKSFKSKLKDAGKREIPYVIVMGEDEVKNDRIALKDMNSGEQKSISFDEAVKILEG